MIQGSEQGGSSLPRVSVVDLRRALSVFRREVQIASPRGEAGQLVAGAPEGSSSIHSKASGLEQARKQKQLDFENTVREHVSAALLMQYEQVTGQEDAC